MSILGNGVDIVDNLRIKKSIKNSNFIKRIYSNDEIRASKNVKNKKYKIHLSLSDESRHSIAFVIINKI